MESWSYHWTWTIFVDTALVVNTFWFLAFGFWHAFRRWTCGEMDLRFSRSLRTCMNYGPYRTTILWQLFIIFVRSNGLTGLYSTSNIAVRFFDGRFGTIEQSVRLLVSLDSDNAQTNHVSFPWSNLSIRVEECRGQGSWVSESVSETRPCAIYRSVQDHRWIVQTV